MSERKTIQVTSAQFSRLAAGERVTVLGPLDVPVRILDFDRITMTITYEELSAASPDRSEPT